jgi:CRISPR-associated protein Cas2
VHFSEENDLINPFLLNGEMELNTYVIYDIENDRIRNKIADVCKDYGLERIQYSAFLGKLSRNKREELFWKLSEVIEDKPGKILIQPICEKDTKEQKYILNDKQEEKELLDNE